MLRLDL